jgi:hypothetical protein
MDPSPTSRRDGDLAAIARRRLGVALVAGALAGAAGVGAIGAQGPVYRAEGAIEVAPPAGSARPWYTAAAEMREALLSPEVAAAAGEGAGIGADRAAGRVVAEVDGGLVRAWWEAPTVDQAARLARSGLAAALPLARAWIGPGARARLEAPPRTEAVERPAGLLAAMVAGLALVGAALAAALAEGAARWRRA